MAETAQFVLVNASRADILSALMAAMGLVDDAEMILVANDIPLNKDTVLGDIVEPSFMGYAESSAVVWTDPYNDELDQLVISGDSKAYICTGGTPDDTIYGAALTDSTGMVLLGVARFAAPVPIAVVGDGLTVTPVIAYGD